MSKGTSKNESKRGHIRIMPGYTFSLQEGVYSGKILSEVNFSGKTFYKIELMLSCLQKKDRKSIKEVRIIQAEKRKQITKIADIAERKRQYKLMTEEDKQVGIGDPFEEVNAPFVIYLPKDNKDGFFSRFLNIVEGELHVQNEMLYLTGRIEHIITIKKKNIKNLSANENAHGNTSHSKTGIYNRSIRQIGVYVVAYFYELRETLMIPGSLIDDNSYKEPIPY